MRREADVIKEGEIPFRAAALNREPSHLGAAHDLVASVGEDLRRVDLEAEAVPEKGHRQESPKLLLRT
jgi:hypothetical protein